MTQMLFHEQIQAVFRKRIPSWDEVPVGDPVKVMAEAIAVSLSQTEVRYQDLLDQLVARIPLLLGFQPRRAEAARVRVKITPNAKLKAVAEVPAGAVLGFKSGERKFEVRISAPCSVLPGVATTGEGVILEVLPGRNLGGLSGSSWETLPLPIGLVDVPEELTLRFPDDTVKTLTRFSAEALMSGVSASDLETAFVPSLDAITIPAADKLIAGYNALVQVHVPTMRVAVDPATIPMTDLKYSGEKGATFGEITVDSKLSSPVSAESDAEFRKRFQFVLQHALVAFHESAAFTVDEVESLVRYQFPGLDVAVDVDTELETVAVRVQPGAEGGLDAFQKRTLRHLVEQKVSLRYEVVIYEGAAKRQGALNVQ